MSFDRQAGLNRVPSGGNDLQTGIKCVAVVICLVADVIGTCKGDQMLDRTGHAAAAGPLTS